MSHKNWLSAFLLVLIISIGTYLVFDLESLTARESRFIDHIEEAVASGIGLVPLSFFPKSSRLPEKFQMGGTPPAVYKLQVTTGRRGRRLTFDLSIKKTADKARAKFEGRWRHEQRANRLGSLEVLPLARLDSKDNRLAKIKDARGREIGVFFLAHRSRALFGLTLKGILLDEFTNFEKAIEPVLSTLEREGVEIMLDN